MLQGSMISSQSGVDRSRGTNWLSVKHDRGSAQEEARIYVQVVFLFAPLSHMLSDFIAQVYIVLLVSARFCFHRLYCVTMCAPHPDTILGLHLISLFFHFYSLCFPFLNPSLLFQNDGGIVAPDQQFKPTSVSASNSVSQPLASSFPAARLARELRAPEQATSSPEATAPSHHGATSSTPISLRGLHLISQPAKHSADFSPPDPVGGVESPPPLPRRPFHSGHDLGLKTEGTLGERAGAYYPEHKLAAGGLSPSASQPPDYRRRTMGAQEQKTSTSPTYTPEISPPDSPSSGVIDQHDDFNDWMLLGGSIKTGSQFDPSRPHPSDGNDSERTNGSPQKMVRERERERTQGAEGGPERGEVWGNMSMDLPRIGESSTGGREQAAGRFPQQNGARVPMQNSERPPSPSASRPHTPSIRAPESSQNRVTRISSFMDNPGTNGTGGNGEGPGMDGETRMKGRAPKMGDSDQQADNKRFSFSSSFWSPRRPERGGDGVDPQEAALEPPGTLKNQKLYM